MYLLQIFNFTYDYLTLFTYAFASSIQHFLSHRGFMLFAGLFYARVMRIPLCEYCCVLSSICVSDYFDIVRHGISLDASIFFIMFGKGSHCASSNSQFSSPPSNIFNFLMSTFPLYNSTFLLKLNTIRGIRITATFVFNYTMKNPYTHYLKQIKQHTKSHLQY